MSKRKIKEDELKSVVRKVKMRRAKDYNRDAKYFYYYYIVFENDEFPLKFNGWDGSETYTIYSDKDGQYILIPIYDTHKKYYKYKVYLKF